MAIELEASDPASEEGFDLEQVRALLEKRDGEGLNRLIDEIASADYPRLVSLLDSAERHELFDLADSHHAIDLIDTLPPAQTVELLDSIREEQAARILDELPSDERADFLGDLSEEKAEALLGKMDPDQAEISRRLMTFADDTAGGLMVAEYLAYPQKTTVKEVIKNMRKNRDRYATYDVQYAYVTDASGKLLGVLRLRDLLLAHQDDELSAHMIAKPMSVSSSAGLNDLKTLFDEYSFLGFPVVDDGDRLLGIVQRSAVEEALSREATATFLKISGLLGGEELRTMPLPLRSGRRLAWLTLNIGLNIIAASVIAMNQDVLEQVIALAVVLPIISDMSGCSGNQAVGVSIRELALNIIKPKEFLRVLAKEGGVGIINGTVLGLLAGVLAGLWQSNLFFGIAVGGALMLNTIVAVCLGGVIPLILRALGKDPALASGPALTTVTDMCGFFFTLTFASLFMEHLV